MSFPDIGPYLTVERADHEKQLLYLKGHPFPFKGITDQGAIFMVDQIKRTLKLVIKRPYRALNPEYMDRAASLMGMHILQVHQLCPVARETFYILSAITNNSRLAFIAAHLLHYDAAYRFRLQDLMSETTREKLIENPRKEIKRLLALNMEREAPANKNVGQKISSLGNLITLALLWPPLKRRFIKALEVAAFPNFQLDEGDRYWCSMRTDYAFGGRRAG